MEAPNITKDAIIRQIILRGLEEHIPRGRGVKKADLIEHIRGLKRRGLWRDVADENAVKRYKTTNAEIPIKPKDKDKGKIKKGGGQKNQDAAPEEEVPPRGDWGPKDERKANAKAERDEARAKAKAEKEAKAKAKAEEKVRAGEEARAKAKAEKEARAKAKAEEEARAKAKAEKEARAKAKAEEEARAKAEEEARAKAKVEEEAKAEAEDKKRPLAPSKIHIQELRNVLMDMNNKGKITGNDAGVVSRLTDIKYYKRQGKEEQKEAVKKMRDLYHKYVYHPYVINNPVRKVKKGSLKQ
jgi:hypothetical protein